MPKIAISGGASTAGGGQVLGTFDFDVRVENRIPAVVGTRVAGHGSAPHNDASQPKLAQGSPTVFVGGRPISRENDLVTCAHPIIGGAADTTAGNRGSTIDATAGGFGDPPTTFVFNTTLNNDTTNYNLRNAIVAAGWNQVDQLTATVTIAPGVTVGSTSSTLAAFQTGIVYPPGTKLYLINNGTIVGRGGNGGGNTRINGFAGSGGGGGAGSTNGTAGLGNVGTGGGPAYNGNNGNVGTNLRGGDGGAAAEYGGASVPPAPGYAGFSGGNGGLGLLASYNITITNNGIIGGGGGGGGQGGGGVRAIFATYFFAAGGRGGDIGSAGAQGGYKDQVNGRGGVGVGGAGGAAGDAINGNSFITWNAFGTRVGNIVS